MDKGKKIIIALLSVVLLLFIYLAARLTISSNITGSIFIDSYPKECEVLINGVVKGKTPVEVDGLKLGEYLVTVRKDGYKEETNTVQIDKNTPKRSVYIALEHMTFSLKVTSYPSEAEVYVDGVKKGVTPIVIDDLLIGKHFVEVKKNNFETWKKDIEATDASILQLDALLNPSSTELVINSVPDKAKVVINNEEKGETPFTTTQLEPGTYDITVYIAGYVPYKESISLEKGQTVQRDIVLQKANTYLSIVTNPVGCNVFINGELKGITPYENANIAVGTYTVRIEKEGYLPYTTDVTIKKGEKTEININLLKLP